MKIVEIAGHDGDAYFAGPSVDAAWAEAREPGSRRTIAYISPSDFLAVAEAGFEHEKLQKLLGYLQRGEPIRELPYLSFDTHTPNQLGRVIGHEGRHRMMALQRLGVTNVPIILQASTMRWGEIAHAQSLERQGTGELARDPRASLPPPQLLPQTRGAGHPVPMPQSVTFPPPPHGSTN